MALHHIGCVQALDSTLWVGQETEGIMPPYRRHLMLILHQAMQGLKKNTSHIVPHHLQVSLAHTISSPLPAEISSLKNLTHSYLSSTLI